MVPSDVARYASEVAARLAGVLGSGLHGVYLHGSGAMGGWHETTSDVDILAVARALTPGEKKEISAALTDPGSTAPGAGLEFSVVTAAAFHPLVPAPPFELHISTGADPKVVDGAGHPGDADLVMHFAVCRARGVAVFGPSPAGVFPEVRRAVLLRAFQGELAWALEHAPPRYAVLNACRAWAFATGEALLSKVEGAAWAIDHGHESELVARALAAQHGGPEPARDEALVEFVAAARSALRAVIDRH